MRTELLNVECIPVKSNLPATIAAMQFAFWGPLTGYHSTTEYERFLSDAANSRGLPTVLVARRGGSFIGSVNLLAFEMTIRPALSPWMAQLFVVETERRKGVGNALVSASAGYVAGLGFRRLYLYTSGTLPTYYLGLGWTALEEVEYLGKRRTIMAIDLA